MGYQPMKASFLSNIYTNLVEEEKPEVREGMNWYTDEHQFVCQLATLGRKEPAQIAGVLSALSPACHWNTCKKWSQQLSLTGQSLGRYKAHITKAQQILNLTNPTEEEVAEFFTTQKTYNFYWNLIKPDDARYICIDSHMFRLMERPVQFSRSNYELASSLIRQSATGLGILPNQLQAVLWEYQRKKK